MARTLRILAHPGIASGQRRMHNRRSREPGKDWTCFNHQVARTAKALRVVKKERQRPRGRNRELNAPDRSVHKESEKRNFKCKNKATNPCRINGVTFFVPPSKPTFWVVFDKKSAPGHAPSAPKREQTHYFRAKKRRGRAGVLPRAKAMVDGERACPRRQSAHPGDGRCALLIRRA